MANTQQPDLRTGKPGAEPTTNTQMPGHQDQAISPSASHITRQLMPTRPSHPAPTLVTIAKRPS